MPVLVNPGAPIYVMEAYIKWFVEDCSQETLNSFRYFQGSITGRLRYHYRTVVYAQKTLCAPLSYGHLDRDGDKLWLGIAVVDWAQGVGLGTSMMDLLLEYADKETIHLSVDKDNYRAMNLYKKFKFEITGEGPHNFFMKKIFDK